MTAQMESRMEALEGKMVESQDFIVREISLVMTQVKDVIKGLRSDERVATGVEKDQGRKQDETASVTTDLNVCIGETQAHLSKALAPISDLQLRKLEITVFARSNPYEWFYQVERYFVVNCLTELEKLEATVLCLNGVALKWHHWEERQRPIGSWEEFCRLVLQRFLLTKEVTISFVSFSTCRMMDWESCPLIKEIMPPS